MDYIRGRRPALINKTGRNLIVKLIFHSNSLLPRLLSNLRLSKLPADLHLAQSVPNYAVFCSSARLHPELFRMALCLY